MLIEGYEDAPLVRLLLLPPVLGDSGLPGDAAALIGAALVRTGVSGEAAPGPADALLQDPPPRVAAERGLPSPSPLSGAEQRSSGIPRCDRPGGPRCGRGLVRGIGHGHTARPARSPGTLPAPRSSAPAGARTREDGDAA
ncbi:MULTISPECIES: hypothetical protein [unclassified Streptomyces]|uniref:hypothetical protein n=1 Tax=unclassified Streptomyces TaxID=2593676 RepID=UPI0037023268